MKQLPFLDCAVLSDRTVLPFGEQHLECTDHIFSGVCCFDDLIYIASLCCALCAGLQCFILCCACVDRCSILTVTDNLSCQLRIHCADLRIRPCICNVCADCLGVHNGISASESLADYNVYFRNGRACKCIGQLCSSLCDLLLFTFACSIACNICQGQNRNAECVAEVYKISSLFTARRRKDFTEVCCFLAFFIIDAAAVCNCTDCLAV